MASAKDPAQRVATEMQGAGHDTVLLKIGRGLIDSVVVDDPDVALVIRSDDSFDLMRVCADLNEALQCRVIVLDFGADPASDNLVIDCLHAGADDFFPGAIALRVMLARIRVALRARPLRRRRPSRIEVGDIVINLDAHAVYVDGVAVNCPPRQFDVLVALASRPNEMVLRDSLIVAVWGVSPESIDSRRVRIAISVLRGVIGTGQRRPSIESVSRVGYRLVVPAPATE
jgi:two-component system response regulator MtrA